MLKKMIVAATLGAALVGSIGVASADFVRRDGTVVREVHTYPAHRVVTRRVVSRPAYYHDNGHHRGWYKARHYHNRPYWDRSRSY
jgi:hypothetical protein